MAIELDRQAKVKKDYVATAGAMQMTAVNENFDLVIGNTPFQLNENAHRQLGLQLKIPAPYYERMRAENPGLLMANVNGWFQQSPDTRRMVRTLDDFYPRPPRGGRQQKQRQNLYLQTNYTTFCTNLEEL